MPLLRRIGHLSNPSAPVASMSFRTLHTAEMLLPMGGAGPLADAAVVVDDRGVVLEVAELRMLRSPYDRRCDHQIVMPGVVNCHTHLTDARRTEPVPGGEGFIRWASGLLSGRDAETADLSSAVADLLGRMHALGTVAVGEVANNFDTLEGIARSGMRCRFIHELIGLRRDRAEPIMAHALEAEQGVTWPENVSYALGAHAPYSVSPELMLLIAERSRRRGMFFYEHLAEDPDERTFYTTGGGPWPEFLRKVGSWEPSWSAPGISPIEFYDTLGLLDEHFVAVHLTDAGDDELALLAARRASAILSPSSNLHITGRLPRFREIAGSGMRFAFGTDGRGSNRSIDVFDEARIMLHAADDLPPGIILEALTSSGAAILGFDDLGAIRPGARPGLIAVEIDGAGDDLRGMERSIISSPISRTLISQHPE